MEVNDLYYNKYLKYKNKYINLQSQIGGYSFETILGRINILHPILTIPLSNHSLTKFNNLTIYPDWKFLVDEICKFYHQKETPIEEQKKFLTWLNNRYIIDFNELTLYPMLFLFYNTLIKCIISTNSREKSIKQIIEQIIDNSIKLIDTIKSNNKYEIYTNSSDLIKILDTATTELRQLKSKIF